MNPSAGRDGLSVCTIENNKQWLTQVVETRRTCDSCYSTQRKTQWLSYPFANPLLGGLLLGIVFMVQFWKPPDNQPAPVKYHSLQVQVNSPLHLIIFWVSNEVTFNSSFLCYWRNSLLEENPNSRRKIFIINSFQVRSDIIWCIMRLLEIKGDR